jgi:serine/threonine-protein kinase
MPPEVASGGAVDGRADLYALGCVGYWLATGKHVFEGKSAYEIVSKHLHETPEPPSHRGPAGIPPQLDLVLMACLEKSPEKRPASARELARMLRRVHGAERWSDEEAEAWWLHHVPAQTKSAPTPSESVTLPG